MRSMNLGWLLATVGIGAFGAASAPVDAIACGCFAPPNPATPVVQAGEQIVFAMKDGMVTMHVRVQYSGPAEEFGWLLPLPAEPTLEVGTEAIFDSLRQATLPTFRLQRTVEGQCWQSGVDAGANVGVDGGVAPGNNNTSGQPQPPSVLVRRETVGPYDAAILRADDQQQMLDWLRDNSYFVPDPLGQAVGPYIRPGGFFLALKLLSDRDAGDISPLVLEYPAELPMIPMILTQVGAEENMPVTAYVLGAHRAIPRNYRHTVLDLAHIDWFRSGRNYVDVVTAAVDEAEGHHSFVTEFSGDAASIADAIAWSGRYGERASLETITAAADYAAALRNRGFDWNTTLVAILQDTFNMPEGVRQAGFEADVFYANLDWFLGPYRDQNPEQFEGADFAFDPIALTERLWTSIVEPTRAAAQLFREHSKLTRLFTTLSPDEMTKDPVFSFNASLPDVDNQHLARFTQRCAEGGGLNPVGVLELPDGRTFETTPGDWSLSRDSLDAPASARIEVLREEGAPDVEVDNTRAVPGSGPGTGPGDADGSARGSSCSNTGGAELGGLLMLGVLALGLRRSAVFR